MAGSSGGSGRSRVRVRRTGGVTGMARESVVDLDSDDDRAGALRDLVGRIDLAAVAPSPARPDHFVYEFDVDGESRQVQEQDLTADLRSVADLVLRPGGAPRS